MVCYPVMLKCEEGASPFLMLARLFFATIISLFCLAGFAGQYDNYPFSIENEKVGNGHRIIARNAGPAPVSVKVAIVDALNIATDRAFPLYVVVPPGGATLYLGRIYPAIANMRYRFRTQYTWALGDFNANQSPGAMYRLPYQDGTTFRIGQSPGGPISTHTAPDSQYAVDIPMPEGTPILAAREGTVIHTEANHVYGARTPEMLGKANVVRILHMDGTIGSYAHLAHGGVYVYPGQRIAAGQQIGLAGSTGYSSGPHLHFAVQAVRRSGDKFETISLPFRFYVGSPAVTFAPQFGMWAKAEYNMAGAVPGFDMPKRIVQASTFQQRELAAPAERGSEILVSFQVPAEVRALLLKAPQWVWLTAVLAIVLLLMMWERMRGVRRRNELLLIREPTLGLRQLEQPIFHGMAARDRLTLACNGDRQKAEWLMAYEYQLASEIDDEEAAQRAWQRLQRERGL